MASDLKPIKLYGGVLGPNPKKVAIILEELNLPFEREYIDFANVKTPDYEAVNPNGRLPAITDPNTGITLWESGAIIEYLISKYDKANKLSFPEGRTESYHVKQWFYFQVSGQGPYYGQAYWFKNSHPEKLQSAIDRYVKEIHRVSKVLDKWRRSGSGLLVTNARMPTLRSSPGRLLFHLRLATHLIWSRNSPTCMHGWKG
jgi:glutathione S-transferase